MTEVVLALGLGFALLNGANDGGALVAASLKTPGIAPATAILGLAFALGVVPAVFGATVARTIAAGLVTADPDVAEVLLGVAVLTALLVVGTMNVRGLPTSLTLALVGGVVGGGLGAGLPISWSTVGLTAGAGIAAPFVGGLLGRGISGLAVLRVPVDGRGGGLRRIHTVAFGLQAVAYAANDGQKIYAVLAAGALGAAATVPTWQLAVVPLLFAIGGLVGVRRASGVLGAGGMVRARPSDEVAAEVSSATAVLASASVGAPVSMTQAVAGSLIGAGVSRGHRSIRWRAAARLGLAWVLTLPSAALLGAGMAAVGGVGA